MVFRFVSFCSWLFCCVFVCCCFVLFLLFLFFLFFASCYLRSRRVGNCPRATCPPQPAAADFGNFVTLFTRVFIVLLCVCLLAFFCFLSLFRFVCFVSFCFVSFCFVSFCFVLFRFVLFRLFVLFVRCLFVVSCVSCFHRSASCLHRAIELISKFCLSPFRRLVICIYIYIYIYMLFILFYNWPKQK